MKDPFFLGSQLATEAGTGPVRLKYAGPRLHIADDDLVPLPTARAETLRLVACQVELIEGITERVVFVWL